MASRNRKSKAAAEAAEQPLELVQMGDIAKMLNVTRQHADKMSNDIRQDFPRPVGRIGNGRVWRRRDITRWARRRGRELGE